MQDDLLNNNDLANAGRKYAQSEASEKNNRMHPPCLEKG
jgi:hypothetical protein